MQRIIKRKELFRLAKKQKEDCQRNIVFLTDLSRQIMKPDGFRRFYDKGIVDGWFDEKGNEIIQKKKDSGRSKEIDRELGR